MVQRCSNQHHLHVAVLTSSRADYGIYYPLLKALEGDAFFELTVVAFGTHLSKRHGETVSQIRADGFRRVQTVDFPLMGDQPGDIAMAIGDCCSAFASYWNNHQFDLVIALGDRFEMFAAVSALVPFNVPLAHIHGGETTRGAIDDAFRNAITHMAELHFTAAEPYRERVSLLKGSRAGVYNTGALSLDNMRLMRFLEKDEFLNRFGVDLNKPTILFTFHPETVSFTNNKKYLKELLAAMRALRSFQFVITMPNADTQGQMIREGLEQFIAKQPGAIGFESLGTLAYLSCMKWCTLMLGNSSSGITEASYFPKPVVNLGRRQEGRLMSSNIIQSDITKDSILHAVSRAEKMRVKSTASLYGNGHAAEKIIRILKKHFKS